MALQQTIVEIPLGVGLQTKMDPKVVPPGSLLTVENGEFDETGAVSKRNGYTALTASKLVSGTIASGKVLATYGDELVMTDGEQLYSYSSEAAKWVPRGTCVAAGIKTQRVPSSAASQIATSGIFTLFFTSSVAAAHGYTAVMWSSDAGGVYATIYGTTTGAVVVDCVQLATAAARRRVVVVASGTKIFFLYPTPANMKMQYFDTAAPASGLSAASNLVTNVNAVPAFDAVDYDGAGTCVMTYRNTTGGGQMSTVKFTTAGVTAGPTVTAVTANNHLAVVVSAAGDVYTAYEDGAGNDLYCFALTSALAAKFASTLIDSNTDIIRISGIEQSAGSILWVFGDAAGAGSQMIIRKGAISSAAAVSGVGTVLRGANVGSGLFASGSALYFVAISDGSYVPAGAWLVNTSGEICGTILPGFASSAAVYSAPGQIVSLGGGIFLTVVPAKFATANPYLPVEVRFEMGRRADPVTFAQSLYIPGAQLWQYDGAQVVEHGFSVAPTCTASDSGADALANGDYSVCVVYEWYDSRGRRHQSAPSVAANVTTAGGLSNIAVVAQTLRLTNKTGVRIVLYATDIGGTTFYRVTDSANDKTADTVTLNFGTVVSLTDNEILYTDGGILENGAPPGMQSLAVRGRRLYGVTPDGKVNYTKDLVDGEGAAFVQETTVRALEDDGGDEWALAAMDSALVAFGEGSIQALTGEGLDDTGSSDTLSQPQRIQTLSARVGNTPVLSTAEGVWFKGSAGVQRLSRSLVVEPIGAAVEDHVALTLVSAVYVPAKNQIRFGHSDGVTLVYDVLSGQWSTFTNHSQVAASFWGTTPCILLSSGVVWQQSAGFTDGDAASITMTLVTPWIKLAGLQGFQRLYYASILGEYRSSHTLTLTPYLDYSQTAGTPLVQSTTTLTTGDPLQMRHHIGVQCEAVKLKIVDSVQAGTKESYTLAALALEIGGMGGIFRQGASKTF